MATFKQLDDLISMLANSNDGMSPVDFRHLIVGEIRKQFGGKKIYIYEQNTSKREDIARALKTLPVHSVAKRYNVTPQYVYQILRGVRRKK